MIYKKIIRPICLILFSIMMIGVCGCMNSQKTKMTVDDCINYMAEKYGENFTYIEPYSDYQANNSMKIIVQSDSMPNSRIIVVAQVSEDKLYINDNYIAVKYEDSTNAVLSEIARQVYGDSRVIYSVDDQFYLSNELDSSASLEEYLSFGKNHIKANILISPLHGDEDKEKEIELLCDILKEKKIVCTINLYYCTEQEKYNSLNSYSEMKLSDNWYNINGRLIINEKCEVDSLTWR